MASDSSSLGVVAADENGRKYSPAYTFDLYLSHGYGDSAWAANLAERLEREEWHGRQLSVFLPVRDIRPGQSISKRVQPAISESRKSA